MNGPPWLAVFFIAAVLFAISLFAFNVKFQDAVVCLWTEGKANCKLTPVGDVPPIPSPSTPAKAAETTSPAPSDVRRAAETQLVDAIDNFLKKTGEEKP
jgi:hypothetical protein